MDFQKPKAELPRENEMLEYKKSTSELKEAVISIAAILNKHRNGELYFGIRNDGSVVGQTVTEQTLRDVSKAISDHIEPKIYPKVFNINLEGKECIKVEFSGNEIPYYAYGRVYMRVADEDKQLSAREIENLIIEKNRNNINWDREFSGKQLTDINENVLKSFVGKANSTGRLEYAYVDVKTTLNKLNLTVNDKLFNAGEVLYCDDNTLEVQMAMFAGNDKVTFLDIKQLKGNLFSLLEQSELYIKNHINWRVKFGKLEREEIPEIPVEAVREALVNSFCHRDYRIQKANEIAIFKNRVEIYNPGDFPHGYAPEDFITGSERSILRNPLISQTLYYSKDIERWGSGLKRIYEKCKELSVKVEFKVLKSGFLVVFYRNEDRNFIVNYEDSYEDNYEDRNGKLSEIQVKILKEIEKNNRITQKELSILVGKSPKSIWTEIEKLKNMKILERIGSDRGGYWSIVK